MKNRYHYIEKVAICLMAVSIVFVGFLYFNNDIGIHKSKIETDIRLSQKIQDDWFVEGMVSDSMAAYISYPQDKSDHTFSVYVNRPGLSFGYFFRGGGDIVGVEKFIAEYTLDEYDERAFISMNIQKVDRIEVDNGIEVQVIDIDSERPFAVVLPVNVGEAVFYDIDGNVVEYTNNSL